MRLTLLVVGALVVGVAGVWLVASAPFDDSARVQLGSGLITGAFVGFAVAAIEWAAERREALSKEARHAAMEQAARGRVAVLVSAHIWSFWWLLLPFRDSPPPLVTDNPQGYGPGDVKSTHRALQWLRERMGADPLWWEDPSLRAAADALLFVSTDLAERMEVVDRADAQGLAGIERSFQSVERVHERTVERLIGIADRLAADGDIERAFALDNQADALQSDSVPVAYVPDLGAFVPLDGRIHVGKRMFSDVRSQVGWLVDQLRADPVTVNEYGVPISPDAPHAAVYRWGPLFGVGDDPSAAWEQRFSSDSWLRRIFETSREELSAIFGVQSRASPRPDE